MGPRCSEIPEAPAPPARPFPRAHATGHAHAHSDLPQEASARGVGRRRLRNGGDAGGVWDGCAPAVSAKRRARAIALWCSRSGRGSMLCLCAWCVVCVCPPPTHTRARHARARSSECGHCPSWPGRPDAAAETPPWWCAHVLTCSRVASLTSWCLGCLVGGWVCVRLTAGRASQRLPRRRARVHATRRGRRRELGRALELREGRVLHALRHHIVDVVPHALLVEPGLDTLSLELGVDARDSFVVDVAQAAVVRQEHGHADRERTTTGP